MEFDYLDESFKDFNNIELLDYFDREIKEIKKNDVINQECKDWFNDCVYLTKKDLEDLDNLKGASLVKTFTIIIRKIERETIREIIYNL